MTSAASWREHDKIASADGVSPPSAVLSIAPIAIEANETPRLNGEAAAVLARIVRAHRDTARAEERLGICRPDRRDCEP